MLINFSCLLWIVSFYYSSLALVPGEQLKSIGKAVRAVNSLSPAQTYFLDKCSLPVLAEQPISHALSLFLT